MKTAYYFIIGTFLIASIGASAFLINKSLNSNSGNQGTQGNQESQENQENQDDQGDEDGKEDQEEDDKDINTGCCAPFCISETKEICDRRAGTWTAGSCDEINECEKGCCAPFCLSETKEICAQKGGDWSAGSCDTVNECEEGCCEPFCVSEKKEICTQKGGDWSAGSCEKIDACVEGCCQPFCENTTKKICDDKAGDFQAGKPCPGYAASMQTADTRIVPDTGTVSYDFRFNFNTCGNHIFTEWKGTIDWLWEFQSDWGNPVPTQKTYEVSFSPDENGYFHIPLGEFTFNGKVTESKMDIDFDMKEFIGKVEASGPVIKSGVDNYGDKEISE